MSLRAFHNIAGFNFADLEPRGLGGFNFAVSLSGYRMKYTRFNFVVFRTGKNKPPQKSIFAEIEYQGFYFVDLGGDWQFFWSNGSILCAFCSMGGDGLFYQSFWHRAISINLNFVKNLPSCNWVNVDIPQTLQPP